MSNQDLASYEALKKKIDYHMDLYYNQDISEISDYEYDQLMTKLKEIEKAHPEWITETSPTQKIGGTAKREAGVKVTHRVPMLSIEDVFTKEDVCSWIDKVCGMHQDAVFSVEEKIDGLSLTLRYQQVSDNKMELILAETRGDGLIGEDVTANARVIPDIKQTLDLPYSYLELRGEVYMTHEDFEAYNERCEAQGKAAAANPRNLAAGTLRQLDPAVTAERGLRMFVFNVQDGPQEMMQSHTKALALLEQAGVVCAKHIICKTKEEICEAIDSIGNSRGELAYDIDGAVVKIDQIAYRGDFSSAAKYSSGHIAYKYPPEEKIVEMDEIEVNVGRTGKLTFTGVFHDPKTGKPARLNGTSVSRATLHNQDFIIGMSIGIGGKYKLFKSGEIIPKLNGCVEAPEEVYQAPTHCPICGELLIREEDTADIRCVNPSCPVQLSRTIAYFASRDCMDIRGLGSTLVDTLVQRGYLHNYFDLYRLKDHRDQLIDEGLIGKEKNTDKVLAAIEESKSQEADRLLAGLGIRNVGRATASVIMRHIPSIESLSSATVDQLIDIPDVGETTANAIVSFFSHESNKEMLRKMKEEGLPMTAAQTQLASTLEGLTIVVTGTLPNLSRSEAKQLIEQNGGKCTGSVSKKTDYLLAGEAAGSKLDKANALGIEVIDEEQFLKMINN